MPTQNNGKLASQTDNVSGEQVVYAYDALNRLASATATSGSWGQSYSYDGFGNLTAQNVTAGSAPAYSAIPDPTTNHVGSVDANGNTLGLVDPDQETQITSAEYDVENRFTGTGASFSYFSGYQYSYAPGNKRVWRGNFSTNGGAPILTTDEVTFWSVNGQKLASYNILMSGNSMIFNQNVANYYFGSKLIGHYTSNVGLSITATDRLGSIGKYYPYGQEKPSATTNGTEKFTGYFRDSETGFDFANQRYHNPGTGRFLTPDPYHGSPTQTDPTSWNMYAYAQGDPVNSVDPTGREIASPGCSSDPDSPACGDCVIDEFDPEWIPICVVDPVPPIIAPPTGGGGGGGEGGEDFVPVSDAQADLNKASCYKLLGFTSATAAQNFFNSISFYYAPFGNLTLKNGVPQPLPAPATTSGYGQVNINTSYNWSNFSKVTTSTGGTFNYLAYINGIWHTNLSSEQLGTEIVIHELEHNIKGMNPDTAAANIAIVNDCIKPQ